MGEKAPLKRNITVDEVAKTALFLSSDLSMASRGKYYMLILVTI
ncbi:MAG: hypothetical protein CM1200mP3_16380 [Chloroflexota bacterium]|nr:MAG: hypothetical protein CM1200mP3_16380 [Chloroflexota bacterium]